MPAELRSKEEFIAVLDRVKECRVKLGYSRRPTKEGVKRVRVLKVKARTPRRLYTIVFENVEEGIEFAKNIKEKCGSFVVLDKELEQRFQ